MLVFDNGELFDDALHHRPAAAELPGNLVHADFNLGLGSGRVRPSCDRTTVTMTKPLEPVGAYLPARNAERFPLAKGSQQRQSEPC